MFCFRVEGAKFLVCMRNPAGLAGRLFSTQPTGLPDPSCPEPNPVEKGIEEMVAKVGNLNDLGILAVQFRNADIGRLGVVHAIVRMARLTMAATHRPDIRSEEGRHVDRETMEILEHAALRHAPTFDARQVLDVLWGLSMMVRRESTVLVGALAARAVAVAPHMNHQEVPGTLGSLKNLRFGLDRHVRHAAAIQIAARAMHPDVCSNLTPAGVAMTLQGNAFSV